MGRLGSLEVSCDKIERGVVHGHLHRLRDHIVDLNYEAGNNKEVLSGAAGPLGGSKCLGEQKAEPRGLGDGGGDESPQGSEGVWVRAVAGDGVGVPLGTSRRHEYLSLLFNTRLNGDDWKAMGEVYVLESLNVSGCNIGPETISRHFRGLRESLEVLSVSENERLSDEDWRSVAEMGMHSALDASFCFMKLGTVSRYFWWLRAS
ncbi:UNVERIFIED_CONTAM: hypothetical protein PYX00_011645 [Menopon gallinae]|uniref:Uncharacterized protein n=1 Tax=Menopon gallinae TaxID=328185 RepID=A0AAW2H842_9NEOP